jgi:K+-sensing histidine kinase KdpD
MNIKNAKNWSTMPRPQAYLAAIAITLAAFGLRYLLHPHLAPQVPFQVFVVTSLLVEYLLGLGPALLSASLGLLLGVHFFIEPYGFSDGISRSDVIVTVNYAFVTLFAIGFVEYLQRTLYSNQMLLKVSQSRHKVSLQRENDRLYLAKKRAAAADALEKLFSEFDQVLLLKIGGGASYPQALLYRLCDDMPALANADAMAAFHPEDQVRLAEELAQVEYSGRRRQTQLRLACGDATPRTITVIMEGIAIEGIHTAVVKLVDAQ